jgi:hypothetical protein
MGGRASGSLKRKKPAFAPAKGYGAARYVVRLWIVKTQDREHKRDQKKRRPKAPPEGVNHA